MFSQREIKKRVIKAIDKYPDYAQYIRDIGGNRYTINRGGNNYTIDLNELSCTCQDFEYHGNSAPCKHIVMAFFYRYFTTRIEVEEMPL